MFSISRNIQKHKFSANKRSNGVLIIFVIIALLFLLSAASSSFPKKIFNKNTQAQITNR